MEDLLKLPEGKLVTGKAKKSALKWLEDSRDGRGEAVCGEGDEELMRRWLVIDARQAGSQVVLELLDEETGETKEADSKEEGVLEKFEAGSEVYVLTQGDTVAEIQMTC